jgi:PIN domain
MPRYTAVLDACVLVPIALADTLLRVAEKGLYRPLWSDRILAEAQAATEEIHPGIDAGKRFAQMREAFDDAVVTSWEELVPGLLLPDEDDRHVLAAVIRGGAQGIITANVKDFPAAALDPLGLEAVHPDDFLLDQLDLTPPTILQVIREQAAHTRRPPLTPRDLATLLGKAGVPSFTDEILRLMANPLHGI